MKNSDYDQAEVNTMVNDLLSFHRDKLKEIELQWLRDRRGVRLIQKDRDTLIGMYDRMAEPGY